MEREKTRKTVILVIKILLTAGLGVASVFVGLYCFILALMLPKASSVILSIACLLLLPSILPFIWLNRRKKYLTAWLCGILVFGVAFTIPYSIEKYEERITIDVTPNIDVTEYMPFTEDSKIVKLDSKTLKMTDNLPVIDGATAVFRLFRLCQCGIPKNDQAVRYGI